MFAKLFIVLTLELAVRCFQPQPADTTCIFDAQLCKLYCASVPTPLLPDNIIPPDDAKTCNANLTVELKNIDFENNTFNGELLPSGAIHELQLRDCKFDKIKNCSLASVSAALKIVNSGMRSLEKTVLESVQNLIQFEFICETYDDFWIESGAFTAMQQLRALGIHKCLRSEEHIRNLTALGNLEVLDLTDNELKQIGSLADFTNLKVIYLQRNKLEGIQRDAFYGTKLHSIDLSDNFLQVIPEGIFAHFRGALSASGNPWDCSDCDLLWFQSYLLQYGKKSNESNEFHPAKCFNQINLVDFRFNCSESNKVACIDASKLHVESPEYGDKYNEIDVNFNGSPVYFTFYDVAEDSLTTTMMTVTGFDSKHFIYWHDDSNITDNHCVTNIPSHPIAMEFWRGSTYTICLSEEENTKVDLNSCFGLNIWEDWSSRTWIPNSWKFQAVILFAVALYICLKIFVRLRRKKPNIVVKTTDPNLNVQEDDPKTGCTPSVRNCFKGR